jgi:chaperonin GroES
LGSARFSPAARPALVRYRAGKHRITRGCVEERKRQNRMKVRPLHDRIIVQRLDEGEQVVGGIIIPDTAKEKPQQGKVVAVGKGKAKDDGKVTPLDVKEGDTILFGKYSGQEIKIDGEELLIMREDEVLAVLEDGGKQQ